jgi:hypothetical protein
MNLCGEVGIVITPRVQTQGTHCITRSESRRGNERPLRGRTSANFEASVKWCDTCTGSTSRRGSLAASVMPVSRRFFNIRAANRTEPEVFASPQSP